MTKHLFRHVTFSCLFFTVQSLLAQLATVPTEVNYTVHYGAGSDGVDLTGFITYDVYLRTVNGNTRIPFIYGDSPDPDSDTLGAYGILTPDDGDLWINTTCATFQHESAGWTVASNNCAAQSLMPSMAWDSFATLRYLCSPTPSPIQNILYPPQDLAAIAAWENDNTGTPFDGGTQLRIDNGGWFGLPSDPSAQPVGNRVLIMRVTTCGDLETCFNVNFYPNYAGDPTSFQSQRLCVNRANPCQEFPMDTTPTVGALLCSGDSPSVLLSDGGNGPVDYQIYSGSAIGSGSVVATINNQASGLAYAGLGAGDYYITMIDSIGCRDTSVVFSVVLPQPLDLNVDVINQVLCNGGSTGQILPTCAGGTGNLSLTMNGATIPCGQVMQNLVCGPYFFSLTDQNGCIVDTTVTLACPAAINLTLNSINISCNGLANGQIIGTVSGGTGLKTINLVFNGNVVNTVSGSGSVNISFLELAPGVYTVQVADANGCSQSQDFTITEPTLLTVSATATDATCFGFCNGTVAGVAQGGSAVASSQVVSLPNNTPVGQTNLCPGDYVYRVTDVNNCVARDTVTVHEPLDITFETSTSNVTCFGACDGEINIANAAGGTGLLSYTLSPATGLCVPPCSGASAQIINLCNGSYNVIITDAANCVKVVPNLVITQPQQISIAVTTQNVTCFGLDNGSFSVNGNGGSGSLMLQTPNLPLPATVNDLAPGTYSLVVYDTASCSITQDIVITQPDLLEVTIDTTLNVTCGGLCDGSTEYTIAGGTGPFIYQFSGSTIPGPADGNFNNLCVGDYQVLFTDINNCQDSIAFSIQEPTPLNIDVQLTRPGCTGMFNGSAVVSLSGGTGNLTSIITPQTLDILQVNDSTYNINNLGETTFYVELYDQTQCFIKDTVQVIPSIITDMVLTMYSSPETCWDRFDGTATCMVQNGVEPIAYSWNDPTNQTSQTAVGLNGAQQYTCIVTDAIGCRLSRSVYVEPTKGCLFVATVITPNGDGANDTWVLGGMEFFPSAKIQVFNRWGQVVFESTGYSSPWNGTYQGQLLPVADYYFIIDYSSDKEPITGTVTIKY